jgi:WD40 repeat protein
MANSFNPPQLLSLGSVKPKGRKAFTILSIILPLLAPLASAAELQVLWTKTNAVPALCISPDGKTVATAQGGAVLIQNVSDGAVIKTLTGAHSIVNGLRFSPDGSYLASSGSRETVIWKTEAWQKLYTFPNSNFSAPPAAFSPLTPAVASAPLAPMDFSSTFATFSPAKPFAPGPTAPLLMTFDSLSMEHNSRRASASVEPASVSPSSIQSPEKFSGLFPQPMITASLPSFFLPMAG